HLRLRGGGSVAPGAVLACLVRPPAATRGRPGTRPGFGDQCSPSSSSIRPARGAEEGEDRRQLTQLRVARVAGRRFFVVWISAFAPRTACVPAPVGMVGLRGPLDRC